MAQTVDIQYLIDRLAGMVQESKRGFFGGRVQVDEAELQQIVDQMRASVPNEIKQARRVMQERANIIKSAQDQAEEIVTLARKQAEYLTSEHGLLQEAKHRTEAMLHNANEERDVVLNGARQFALEAVIGVDSLLEQLDDTVSENRGRVRRVLDSLQDAPPPPTVRERRGD